LAERRIAELTCFQKPSKAAATHLKEWLSIDSPQNIATAYFKDSIARGALSAWNELTSEMKKVS